MIVWARSLDRMVHGKEVRSIRGKGRGVDVDKRVLELFVLGRSSATISAIVCRRVPRSDVPANAEFLLKSTYKCVSTRATGTEKWSNRAMK